MFEITPTPFPAVVQQLSALAERLPADVWARVQTEVSRPAQGSRPFVQLAADEITIEEIEEVLGYGDIPSAAGPFGLPWELSPVATSDPPKSRLLFFPLGGLDAHLRRIAPSILAEIDRHGSMDAYVEARGDDLTAREYLIGGIIGCIRFCQENREALVIRW